LPRQTHRKSCLHKEDFQQPPRVSLKRFDKKFRIFHEAQEYKSLLVVVCFQQEEFHQNDESLVKYIKKEGMRLIQVYFYRLKKWGGVIIGLQK